MRIIDILRRARRSLAQAKGRTILTSLAISVGAFTIALALAAGNGGRAYLDNIVGGAGDMRTIQVSARQDAAEPTDDGPKKLGEADVSQGMFRQLDAEDRKTIAAVDGVEQVSPIFGVNLFSVAVPGGDEYQGTMDVQYDGTVIDLTAGKLGDNNAILPGQIVLPHTFVTPFGFENAEAALGKKVVATFEAADNTKFTREFTVIAVDAEPSSPLSFYQNQFRISNKDGEEISQAQLPEGMPEQYYSLMVTAKEGVDVTTLKERILAAGEYDAMTFAEMRTSIMQVVNIVQYGLMGFGLLAIIASVFGIINTQYISVLERTQQIGLMKSLGMRSRDVARLFRYEAAWIGFLGGVIGVVLAFFVTLLNPVINNALSLEEGTALLQLDIVSSLILIIGLMIVAVASGYFPSRKAAKLDPIEALRTE